eukprot:PhM_4_TR9235/c0_g2_i1/m.72564
MYVDETNERERICRLRDAAQNAQEEQRQLVAVEEPALRGVVALGCENRLFNLFDTCLTERWEITARECLAGATSELFKSNSSGIFEQYWHHVLCDPLFVEHLRTSEQLHRQFIETVLEQTMYKELVLLYNEEATRLSLHNEWSQALISDIAAPFFELQFHHQGNENTATTVSAMLIEAYQYYIYIHSQRYLVHDLEQTRRGEIQRAQELDWSQQIDSTNTIATFSTHQEPKARTT